MNTCWANLIALSILNYVSNRSSVVLMIGSCCKHDVEVVSGTLLAFHHVPLALGTLGVLLPSPCPLLLIFILWGVYHGFVGRYVPE
jgi:hypothetical protein